MSRGTSRSRKKPVELFVSYSHSDAVWLGRLKPFLQFEHCRDKAYVWDDQKMKAGDRWDNQIKAALDRMDVFVCLVSTKFLASAYVRTVELPRAFEREENGEIVIVPVVIYPNIDLNEECPELQQFNPLPKWDECWRKYEGDRGDYSDADGLIRSGLRQAIARVKAKR